MSLAPSTAAIAEAAALLGLLAEDADNPFGGRAEAHTGLSEDEALAELMAGSVALLKALRGTFWLSGIYTAQSMSPLLEAAEALGNEAATILDWYASEAAVSAFEATQPELEGFEELMPLAEWELELLGEAEGL